MKQSVLFAALGLAALGVHAQEVGRVLSSNPVIEQVAVPRQVCSQMPVVQPQTSGGGGLLGAIAGGAVGSTIGGGAGTAAAIVAGTALGAIVGNNIEANNQRYAQSVPQCVTETTYENRTVGYDVSYEYAGRQYATRMPYDPGATIMLNVSPVASANTRPANAPVVVAPPVQSVQAPQPVQVQPVQTVQAAPVIVTTPAPVVYAPYSAYPAYPAYPYPAYRPWYPSISLGFVFGGGGHRHGGRHWRH